jgi:Fe-S cluster assembly protein SufD
LDPRGGGVVTSTSLGATAAQHFVEQYQRFAGGAAAAAPRWLAALRERGMSRLRERGFPTARDEDWKYTNVSRLLGVPFRTAVDFDDRAGFAQVPAAGLFAQEDAIRLLFVNGRFVGERSAIAALPAGARVESIALALRHDAEPVERHLGRYASADQSGFTALSAAFLTDGAIVALADGVELERPIELVFVATTADTELAVHPRVLVTCGRGSRLSLVESYESSGATLTNAVAEIVLGEGARIEHVRVVREGERGSHVATTEVVQARDSRYASSSFALGASFLRHTLNVRLQGEGAECSLDGLYLAAGDEVVDNHTAIDHSHPHATSRELYKGVLGGRAKGVFNGKVIVRPDAQKSDARQTNKNLLLSRHAEIDSKPELQIYADDVKCSHGAAIGQLDADALFYLKSRGIGEAAGRRLLIRGFAAEIVQRVRAETLRGALEAALEERLSRIVEGDA